MDTNFGSGSVWVIKMVIAIYCWNCVITLNGEKTPSSASHPRSNSSSLSLIEQVFTDPGVYPSVYSDCKSATGENPGNVRSIIGALEFCHGFGMDRSSGRLCDGRPCNLADEATVYARNQALDSITRRTSRKT